MKILEQLPTIPFSDFDFNEEKWDVIIKINDDNIFYAYCSEPVVIQIDGLDVWRWKLDTIDINKLRNFIVEKISAWEQNPEQDFEMCQWFTDEYY